MIRNILFSLVFISLPCLAFQAIHLGTQDRPPYTWPQDGKPAGPFDKVVVCALESMGVEYSIDFLPWARAQSMTQRGQLDGFYAGSQNAERDSYATASRFIGKQNWAYFYLADVINQPIDDEYLKNARVGAYLGSNMAQWLKTKGVKVAYRPVEPEMLLEGLIRDRADIILANEAAMLKLTEKTNRSAYIDHQVVVSKPIAVYFGKTYLNENPNFINAFNQAASQCLPEESLVIYSE